MTELSLRQPSFQPTFRSKRSFGAFNRLHTLKNQPEGTILDEVQRDFETLQRFFVGIDYKTVTQG